MRYPSIKTILTSATLGLLLTVALLSRSVSAQEGPIQLPAGFSYQTVVEKLDGPTSFALAPDGRIFITQKAGAVKVFQNGSLLRENFIDISSEVNQHADRGLMSVAIHPNFPATPYIYLAYVYEPPEAAGFPRSGGRVSRLLRVSADPANPNRYLPGFELVLLGKNSTFKQIGNPSQPEEPPFSCANPDGSFVQDCLPAEGVAHILNHMIFGRDGSLLVSNGDGTVNQEGNIRAQQIDSLAGKILRIDPISGQGYSDNPFFDGNPNSNRSKVYALGLRNPFRIAENPQIGALMVAEVGNNSWEELSQGFAGANFGWPCFEGPDQASIDPACDPLFTGSIPVVQAIHQYQHVNGFGAAIGGDFTVGNQFPAAYQGAYFFSDYPASVMQYLTFAGGQATVNNFADNVWKIVQTQSSPDGSLYLLSIGRGELGRIIFPAGSEFQALQPQAVSQPAPMQNQILIEEPAIQQPAQETTSRPLKVFIQRVTEATPQAALRNAPPQAIILEPDQNLVADIGTVINLRGTGVDELGTLSGQSLTWDAILHHKDHIHYDFFQSSGAESSFTVADHGDNTYIELCLTATDLGGLAGTSCVDIRSTEVTYTVQSEPSGIELLYDGTRYTTPFEITTYVGARRFIGAPLNPIDDLTFAGWSNQGPRQQRITIQSSGQTITARYSEESSAGNSFVQSNNEEENNASQGSEEGDSLTPFLPTVPSIASDDDESSTRNFGLFNPEINLTNTGSILREWWVNIQGNKVSDLISDDAFPNQPSGSELLPRLEGPAPFGNNYGTRIRGYLHPPVSGLYLFWIASDDNGQLWLSGDASPANKVQIATVTHWTPRNSWYRQPEQASAPIYLEAGEKYYIEVLHKEAGQKDNISVAWQIPGGPVEVIDGQYLSPPDAP